MSRVTIEQLDAAIAWLRCNEGSQEGEAEACHAVAAMLERECERREFESAARVASKRGGITLKRARALLRSVRESRGP